MQEQYKYSSIIFLFLAGAVITAAFSASLYVLYPAKTFKQVMIEGMLIPAFTWFVQTVLAILYLREDKRRQYLFVLGKVCLIGSVALLPAAAYNIIVLKPSPFVSVNNTVLSVMLMLGCHIRYLRRFNIPVSWSYGWLLTITVNMCLYYFLAIR